MAYDSTVEHDDTVFWDITCRRKSLRRVDCIVLYGRQGRRLTCDSRAAIEAGADGVLRARRYSCSRRRKPPVSPLRNADILPLP